MIEFYTGDVSLANIRRAGRMEITGSRVLELTLADWLPTMALAHVEAGKPPGE